MKTQEKTKKASKTSKNDIFTMFVGAIAIPFLIVYYVLYFAWRLVYRVFFALPNQRSLLLGLFRVFLTLGIMTYCGKYLISDFAGDNPIISLFGVKYEWVGQLLIFVLSAGLLISFFSSLLVATGMHTGMYYYIEGEVAGDLYSNIKEAFEFRDGVLGQQTNTEKMHEMAKTGFSTNAQFQNATTENERSAMEYLDGQLGMCSTRGKYEKLKELYSEKK